nr:hypothetical protein [Tanacetum cinerariifolium]
PARLSEGSLYTANTLLRQDEGAIGYLRPARTGVCIDIAKAVQCVAYSSRVHKNFSGRGCRDCAGLAQTRMRASALERTLLKSC